MEERRRCAACGEAFLPCSRVRDQKYCGKEDCRRARRRRWQRAKRQVDTDYADNQKRAQGAWRNDNGAYWQRYRAGHPRYAEENRERTKQRKRDRVQAERFAKKRFAKMDSISTFSAVRSGTYLLVPQGEEEFAKMDSIMVKIILVPKA